MANYVKFMRGSPLAYQNLKDAGGLNDDTLYFIYDVDTADGELYLGAKLIAGSESLETLSNIEINEESLEDQQVLAYDAGSDKWVNITLKEAISDAFVGATIESSGVAGLVPAPAAGQTHLFLRSDGTWAPVSTSGNVDIVYIQDVQGLDGYLTETHFSPSVVNKINYITDVEPNHFIVVDGQLSLNSKQGRLLTPQDEIQLKFIENIDTSTFEIKPIIIGQDENGKNITKNTLHLISVSANALAPTLGDLKTLPIIDLGNGDTAENVVEHINNIYSILSWGEVGI